MAWLAAATNNDDLVDQLVENGILTNEPLRRAFALTDRGDFVQSNFRAQAYFDRPFKQAYVHISAPHMYATVLEALELTSGMSFLNVGSGSGYLSCLAACLLEDCGLSHGVDVNASVVAHSERCCKVWFEGLVRKREQGEQVPKVSKEGVSFVHGNCFHLDIASSVHTCRYDRIYVGAGCPESRKEFFFSLLADDGILVASINERNELIQVRRRHRHIFTETVISNVIFAPLVEPTEELDHTSSRPLTFPMLQMRRQRSGTMSSVTTNASTISSVLDAASSARRRSSSVGGETDNSEEQSALLSSLSSSPPSNTISLSASPLTSLLTEASLNSLLRTTHIPNTHLGFSMSMLSTTPPQSSALASAQNPFISPYAATSSASSASSSAAANGATAAVGTPRTPDTSRSAADGAMQVVPDTARSAEAVSSAPGTARSNSIGGGSGVASAISNMSNGSNGNGESSHHSPRVVPVRLPPVLWAPIASRHAQFPQTFKKAVLTLLMASRRPVSYVQIPSSNSSSSSAMTTKQCLCGAVPMHIWVLILSFASRDWFVPELSERELMMDELTVEQALRQVAETLLRREQAARRQAERERDMFQSLLRRMRMAASRGRRILFNQDDDEEDEDEVNIVTHEVDEEADDDDEDEVMESEEEEDEEEDGLDHEHDSEIEGEEAEPHETADSDDDDDTGVDIRDWNDEDDDIPELIRIHDGDDVACVARSSGTCQNGGATSSRHGNGHGSSGVSSNGHATRNSRHHASAVASMTELSVEEDGEANEEEGSPARKNPRCTVSPTATCLPVRHSSQALSMEVVDNGTASHQGESSSSSSSGSNGGSAGSVDTMDIASHILGEDDSAESSAVEMAL